MTFTPFIHYFEIFVGSNAAIAGFNHTRSYIYEYVFNVTDSRMRYEADKASASLLKLKTRLQIFLAINGATASTPISISDIEETENEFDARFISRYNDYVEMFEKTRDVQEHLSERKTIPWFVFCLLYSLLMVIIVGIEEYSEHTAHYLVSFVFYMNFLVISGILLRGIFYKRWDRFALRLRKFYLKMQGKDLYLFKFNKYTYVRRYIKRFFKFVGISIITTGLMFILSEHCEHYIENCSSWIVLSSLFICCYPLIHLIIGALRWKNRNLRPIANDILSMCKDACNYVSQCDDWVVSQGLHDQA